MAIIYNKRENSQRIREPLFQVNRTKYRNTRSSQLENLETNLFKLDISRINGELESAETRIISNVSFFYENPSEQTSATKLNDGITKEIPQIQSQLDEVVEVYVTSNLSGKLSRLLNKIQRLESGI